MPSLLLVVFVLQLCIHLLNTVGAPVVNEFLWNLYNRLPFSTSSDAQSQTELRREIVKLKREMAATSSQDEFAKWAKLRRTHDKKVLAYDEKNNNTEAFKSSFDRTVTTLRFLSTNGLRFFLQFWYAKRALFWIPKGWVPGYVEWLLAFPRAPTGSVSIQIWGTACATVVQMVGAAVVAGLVLVSQQREKQGRQGIRVESATGGIATPNGKKEL